MIATINVASASVARAEELANWLPTLEADLIVLTETSLGKGTALLTDWFGRQGWNVVAGEFTSNERGVAIVSRAPIRVNNHRPAPDPLPGRAVVVDVPTQNGPITVVGMYLPTRGNDAAKLQRKLEYMKAWADFLPSLAESREVVLVGDLNLVPRQQRPRLFPQLPVEYAWLDRLADSSFSDLAVQRLGSHEPTWLAPTGEGYTFDHVFATQRVTAAARNFEYRHDSRQVGASDHSGLRVDFGVNVNFDADRLHASPLIEEPLTLF